jgi:hypothetical protein
MICDDCQTFWDDAVCPGAISKNQQDGTISWTGFTSRLYDINSIESRLHSAPARCSMCVSARFSLTESEYADLPTQACFIFELVIDQYQGKPTLKAKVVDKNGKDVVNSRMIAILEMEARNGIFYISSSF